MTREEAITLINSAKLMLINPTDNEPVSDLYEALDMAIKALEQEPCDDEITLKVKRGSLKIRQGDMVIYNVAWLREHWQMEMDIVCGVKPCDDAISREYMKKIAQSEGAYGYVSAYDIATAPSVTPSRGWEEMTVPCENCGHDMTFKIAVCGEPSRHKGHWIEEEMYDQDICYRCSECNEVFCLIEGTPELNEYHYCPNCGAEMVEPQEGEEQTE